VCVERSEGVSVCVGCMHRKRVRVCVSAGKKCDNTRQASVNQVGEKRKQGGIKYNSRNREERGCANNTNRRRSSSSSGGTTVRLALEIKILPFPSEQQKEM